jgi:hypothetical protein
MKRTILLLGTAAACLGFAVTASAAAGPTLVIRHQVRGCHSWSLNGGPYKAATTLHVRRGTTLKVVDNDIMPHLLVQTGGPKAVLRKVPSSTADVKTPLRGSGLMAHLGASVTVRFPKAGVYRFTTKAGEDYVEAKTIGEDNVLRLTVVVS